MFGVRYSLLALAQGSSVLSPEIRSARVGFESRATVRAKLSEYRLRAVHHPARSFVAEEVFVWQPEP